MMKNGGIHTIADIARLAGVSKSTVSRALNDSPLIGAETKERIRSLAGEHQFRMNVPARRLSLKQSNAVALVSYAYSADSGIPDAFMLEIMGGISAGLYESDYDLLVIHVRPTDSEWVHRYLASGRVDGFILLSAMCKRHHLDSLVEAKAPFVMWGNPPGGAAGCCSVMGDSVTGGRIATEHLIESGRRRIAFLGGPAHAPEVRDRLEGYRDALTAAGREVDPALVVHASWLQPEASSAAATQQLLERAPDIDALFANSDLLALGAIDALRIAGRHVPDDVAVIGYDDIAIARHSNPALTTIRQDGPLAGRLLAENLIRHIQTGVLTNVSIPAEIVVRESA